MRLIASPVFLIMVMGQSVNAATVNIAWKNSPSYELKNQTGQLLAGGVLGDAGDGTALELGYYSLATTTSPFSGVWIPFTGQSIPGGQVTTIGDKLEGNGIFDLSSGFDTATDPFVVGAIGRPLSIRFYDTIPGVTPTFFNAVLRCNGFLDRFWFS